LLRLAASDVTVGSREKRISWLVTENISGVGSGIPEKQKETEEQEHRGASVELLSLRHPARNARIA